MPNIQIAPVWVLAPPLSGKIGIGVAVGTAVAAGFEDGLLVGGGGAGVSVGAGTGVSVGVGGMAVWVAVGRGVFVGVSVLPNATLAAATG